MGNLGKGIFILGHTILGSKGSKDNCRYFVIETHRLYF
jgi:hypothetical protein